MPLMSDDYRLPRSPASRQQSGYVNPGAGLNLGFDGLDGLGGMPGQAPPPPEPMLGGVASPNPQSSPQQFQFPFGQAFTIPTAPQNAPAMQNAPAPQSMASPQLGTASNGTVYPERDSGIDIASYVNGVRGGQSPNQNLMLPASAAPGGLPGHRLTIPADGGQQFLQPILPGERTPNGQDAMRMGSSMAEIQQGNPGWSASQQMEAWRRMQGERLNGMIQNMRVGNESANRGAGIMTNHDAVAQQTADANTLRTRHDTDQNRSVDRIIEGILGQGGAQQDITDALAARQNALHATQPSNAPRPTVPPMAPAGAPATVPPVVNPPAATPAFGQRELDQFFRNALQGAGIQAGTQPAASGRANALGIQRPAAMPATAASSVADNAITNFVHSLNTHGHLTPNIQAITPYMVQMFGPQAVDRWYGQTFYPWSGGPTREAVEAMMAARGHGMQPSLSGRLLDRLFSFE